MSEGPVRDAFRRQAGWSERLGSPFMARLCEAFASHLDRSTPIGARLLDWPGDPDSLKDALPLRVAGGLHALVRRGRLPHLGLLYPPHPLPEAHRLWAAVAASFRDAQPELAAWLDQPPQTNEVARSALLLAGFAVATERTGQPLALLELGASAGLNLLADRYSCRLGGRELGQAGSPVRIEPAWSGPDPPSAALRVSDRRGVDLHPLDLSRPADRERLPAYVWPDQTERLARLEAAITLAAANPPRIERGDAGIWLEAQLAAGTLPGVTRLVFHSIAFQYFSPATQSKVRAVIAAGGERATSEAPFAWLRFESDPEFGGRASLRLTVWPDGEERVLAVGDPHVRRVEWLG